jgi:predicted PurR-regulated permease PerM
MDIEARPIRLSPVAKFITVAIIVALTILLFRAMGHAVAPFVAAIITAYLFNPVITWLHRRTHVGRAAWILVLYVLIGALIYALVRFLGPIITGQYNDLVMLLPAIRDTILYQIEFTQTVNIAGLMVDVRGFEEPLIGFITDIARTLPEVVPHLVLTALESLLLFLTYLIITFYLLLQADQIMGWIYNLVPAPYRGEIRGLGLQIDKILAGYIRGTLLLIPIMSVLTYIVLSILGVRYALVIAIATGFLEIIPLVGPWSAAGIAMTVALFQPITPFGWSHLVLVSVVGIAYFVLRMFEDSVIIPHVVGHAVHLHPVLVLFAILAGGVIGGPFGLLISIPVVAVVRLLLRYLYHKLVDAPDLPASDDAPPPASVPAPPKVIERRTVSRASQSLKTRRG